jgi:hypothetical protein
VSYCIIVSTTAEQQTLKTALYYESQQAGLAERFLSDLDKTYEKIENHPEYYGFISGADKFRDVRLHSFSLRCYL